MRTFYVMRKLIDFGKVLMILAGLLVLAGNANVSQTQVVVIESHQNESDQSEQEEVFIQSFDVVSQNVQLQLISNFILNEPSVEIEEITSSQVKGIFRVATSAFFKILFQKIISPNAP